MILLDKFKDYILLAYEKDDSYEYRRANHLLFLLMFTSSIAISIRFFHSFPSRIQDIISEVLILNMIIMGFYLIKIKKLDAMILLSYIAISILVLLQIIYSAYVPLSSEFIHPYHIFQTTSILILPPLFFSFSIYKRPVMLGLMMYGVFLHVLHAYALSFHSETNLVMFLSTVAISIYIIAFMGVIITNRFLNKQTDIILSQKQELEIREIELKEKNNILEKFAHVIAHDLKEPQRTVSSYLGLLERELKKDDIREDKIKIYSSVVFDSNKRMRYMIDSLLNLGKINFSQTDSELVELSNVIETVMSNVGKLCDERGAIIRVNNLGQLEGNFSLYVQLFQNLIVNSIKYCSEEIKPIIEIDVLEDDKELQVIQIKDNGVGIPENHLKSIFEIFNRGGRKKNNDGSGIGLTICKKIVELHHGRISVKSEVDKGTTFYLKFPQCN